MTQIGNPSHTDPSRVGFLTGAVPGIVIAIFLPVIWPRLTGFGAAFIGLVVTLVIGVSVTRWLQKKRAAKKQAALISARIRDEAETMRQIAEMKKRQDT